jgi:hypothetical protein
MVVTKQEVQSEDNKQIQDIIRRVEPIIDNMLRSHNDNKLDLEAYSKKAEQRTVIYNILKQKYEAAGWTVIRKSGSCQRDGDWDYIQIS